MENRIIYRKIGKDDAKYRIFCFPYAGAGASAYINFSEIENIQFCLVQLPGRENRKQEELVSDAKALADSLTMELLDYIDRPFALYGHSMGGVIAYLVALRLEMININPTRIYLSASSAYRKKRAQEVSCMDSKELTAYLRNLGGIDDDTASNKQMQSIYYPIIRNDYRLVENYTPTGEKLHCGIMAFASKEDREVNWEEAVNMKNLTEDFSINEVNGNHFFIKEKLNYIVEEIKNDLKKSMPITPQRCNVLGDIVKQWGLNERKIITINEWKSENVISYKRMKDRVMQYSFAWQKLGIKKGDTVMLQISNLMEYISVLWSCFYSGIVVVPLDCKLDGEYREEQEDVIRLKSIADIVKPKAIIAGETEKENVSNLLKGKNIISIGQIKECLVNNEISSLSETDIDAYLKLHLETRVMPKDIAMMVFTSGSTGKPKGVILTHENILAGIYGDILKTHEKQDDIFLNWMPLEHVASLVMNHILQGLLGAVQIQVRTSIILEDIKRWLIMQSKYKVNHTWAPNFAYDLIKHDLKNILLEDLDLSSVKTWVNAGEMINYKVCAEVLEELNKKKLSNKAMVPCWGMTEAATGILYSYSFGKNVLNNTVTVGKTIPGVYVRIVDDNNNVLENEEGRLQIKGKSIFSGYFEFDNSQNNILDGWFDTGDCGRILNGEIFITGRTKDIFIVNGCNISCYEIEEGIKKATGIEIVHAVVKRDDECGKEKLYIFLNEEGVTENSLNEIKTFLGKRYCVSYEEIYAIKESEFPRSIIGKIEKNKLFSHFRKGKYKLSEEKASSNNQGTTLEKQLIHIWQDVLETAEITADEDFFHLGGTSIKIPVLLDEIYEKLKKDISISRFFEDPTINGLIKIINENNKIINENNKKTLEFIVI